MSEQGTPRPWRVADYYALGPEQDILGPNDQRVCTVGGSRDFTEDTRGWVEPDAGLIVAAVNACHRLVPGLPPDKLEEYVRALVRAAGEAERFLREVSPLLREANRDVGAVMIAQVLELALAPFAHLGGEP